jgi:hypothetical protein
MLQFCAAEGIIKENSSARCRPEAAKRACVTLAHVPI